MLNYQNGKIYKIVPVDGTEGEIYIGSTIQPLNKRHYKHNSDYLAWKDNRRDKVVVYDLFDKYGYENCEIVLIENYPCDTLEELRGREGYHQKNTTCINKLIAGRTKSQYYQDKKEHFQEYKKVYNQANKDIIYAKRSVSIICNCGMSYTLRHKARHEKTKKHQEYIDSL